MRLVDECRPATLDGVIGHDKPIATLRRMIGRKDFDRGAFWISGASGIGKTTIAEALAVELGAVPDEVIPLNGESFDSATARRLGDMLQLFPRGPFRVVIIDEAHAMSKGAVQALLTMLQEGRLKARNVFIFTTTEESRDLFGNFSRPLSGRCTQIHLSTQGLAKPFTDYIRKIAEEHGINGRPESYYRNLVKETENDLRAVLQALDSQIE